MVTQSVFEVGEFVADGLNDKATIYVDFNDRSQVKSLGCFYDFVKAHWYTYVNNLYYCNGSLFYPIVLFVGVMPSLMRDTISFVSFIRTNTF